MAAPEAPIKQPITFLQIVNPEGNPLQINIASYIHLGLDGKLYLEGNFIVKNTRIIFNDTQNGGLLIYADGTSGDGNAFGKAETTGYLVFKSGNNKMGVNLPDDIPNSGFDVRTSLALSYNPQTADYTVTDTDYTVDCTTGSFTVTLPTAAGITGRTYAIINSGLDLITLQAFGSETIAGSNTQILSANNCFIIQATSASSWIVLSLG